MLIDGNCSYSEIGKQHFFSSLELYKRDNELLYLSKEKKTLEDEFNAFKKLVDHERNDRKADDVRKLVVLTSLKMNLKVNALILNSTAFELKEYPLHWSLTPGSG